MFLPTPVIRALATLGRDVSAARRRQRIPVQIMADRALVSRSTIARVERGDPTVAFGTYATVLFVLGLVPRVAALADAQVDTIGADLAEEALPKRIRLPRAPKQARR